MACSCCAFGITADEHLNADKVAKELAQYRRKGPGPTTRRLRDGLLSAELREGTLLSSRMSAEGMQVHDLDLKGGKFGAPECSTVDAMIEGLQLAYQHDEASLSRA
jgi:hypothetical protein